ncbi:Bacterial transglutaminase-like cysteine proteinase BTLCP [Tepidimonas fonticaldi]|uniref:Bacterial transglutaminase-like cysteine proteinase BTLCP n=1 Tax=Tepidimonas fonticaldi TaxID=1101373 RepID=A0A554XHI7_9BURK|nr:transglutaminase-like cysteine peptidase [Tepidimonas fonticaldi]TSE35297.1 Bacterial transglutaminase-like cysteine proteinase BTLCP [Tepidimonas fonticaldi]
MAIPPTRCNARPGRGSWLASGLLALALALGGLAGLGWALAAANLDRMQQLARERYGPTAEETVIAWRRLLAEQRGQPVEQQLAAVNTFFNRRILYELDPVVWNQNDYWATPLEFMGRAAGDCEDFAIAKYMTLLELGVPNERLRMIYVRARTAGAKTEAHMVLGYYENPSDEPLILDNLVTSIRPASRRPDLTPVFSFNSQGLWVAGQSQSSADPTARLSRWREVLDRMKQEGL